MCFQKTACAREDAVGGTAEAFLANTVAVVGKICLQLYTCWAGHVKSAVNAPRKQAPAVIGGLAVRYILAWNAICVNRREEANVPGGI